MNADAPVWVDVRCPWCMALLGHRIAARTVSGIGLIRSHTPHCEGDLPKGLR